MTFRIVAGLYLALMTFSSTANEIQLVGNGGFKLFADYTPSSSNQGTAVGVLMLHQCNADKSMYHGLAKKLSKAGISSMSLDFRGYGKSVTEEMSIEKLREKATSREHYFKMANKIGLGNHRANDVEIAYQYLRAKLGNAGKIAFIGASCGGTQAVIAAQKHRPESFIFFSSGINNKNQELFIEMSDTPALIIASQDDGNTFKTANNIFLNAKNKQSRMLAYKGNAHGRPLFKQDKNLEDKMVNWFKLNFQ